jgi:hypothetical protein
MRRLGYKATGSERNKLDAHEGFFRYRWLSYVKEFWWRKILEIVQLEDQKINGQIESACYGDTSFIT